MEWTTIQHLDLRHVGRGTKPLQPHAAAFHPHQALVAVAIGTYILGQYFFLLYFICELFHLCVSVPAPSLTFSRARQLGGSILDFTVIGQTL